MNKNIIRLTEYDLHQIIKESVNSILESYVINEKRNIKSKKLYNILQQHGGVEKYPGQHHNYVACLDFHNMTDDDVIGVFDYKDICTLNDERPSQDFLDKYNIKLGSADMLDREELRDGKYLLAILRGGKFDRRAKRSEEEIKDGDFEKRFKKQEKRRRNKPNTYQVNYKWENEKAEDLFKNPYWRNKSGSWSDVKNYKRAFDNVKNGRYFWDRNEK
jgi:hypothetical protein